MTVCKIYITFDFILRRSFFFYISAVRLCRNFDYDYD